MSSGITTCPFEDRGGLVATARRMVGHWLSSGQRPASRTDACSFLLLSPHAIFTLFTESRTPEGCPGARVSKADAHPGTGDASRARGTGHPRLRINRKRQDRRIPAAHSSNAHRKAQRPDASARAHTDPRAGGPDPLTP